MADEEDSGSDSSDENYVPSGEEAVSEDDQSGEDEGLLPQEGASKDVKIKKRKRGEAKCFTSRKRSGGIRLDEKEEEVVPAEEDDYNDALTEEMEAERVQKKADKEKKREDSLWADFMKDTPAPKRPAAPPNRSTNTTRGKESASPAAGAQKAKVTVTKEFDFAGETIKVSKEVSVDSKEARRQVEREDNTSRGASSLLIPAASHTITQGSPATTPSSLSDRVACVKNVSGGLGSVLGKLDQKPKLSTLEKSKLDWNSFKAEQGINEELQIHNRGKEGYVARQAFLMRADQRQFEVERKLRLGASKR